MDNEDAHDSQEETAEIMVDMGQQLPPSLAALLMSVLDSTSGSSSPTTSISAPITPPRARRTPARVPPRIRNNRLPRTPTTSPQAASPLVTPATPPQQPEPFLWADRIKAPPAAGYMRPLSDPDTEPNTMLRLWWSRDRTLTQWSEEINRITEGRGTSSLVAAAYPADYEEQCWALLNRIQRERWLARKVITKFRNRIWMKKSQCNIDLIDMEPVADRDAVYLTDTKHKTIFKFHRRDLFSNLMSNITSSDEMLPTPRLPTNPYTNAPLTFAQTIAVCQALLRDYAFRGRCPPVLFAAFCAAGYNLDTFVKKTSSLLAQHAIQAYFKDITPHNIEAITETVMQLLTDAGTVYSPVSVRRWLRQTPVSPLHKEWLDMARDFTLYMNLHVQTRDTWYSEAYIHADVRALYERTPLPESESARLRTIRNMFYHDTPGPGRLLPLSVEALLGNPFPVAPSIFTNNRLTPIDDMADAMNLIRAAMFGTDLQNRSTNQNNASWPPGGGPSIP